MYQGGLILVIVSPCIAGILEKKDDAMHEAKFHRNVLSQDVAKELLQDVAKKLRCVFSTCP